jgi:hypothetical protein
MLPLDGANTKLPGGDNHARGGGPREHGTDSGGTGDRYAPRVQLVPHVRRRKRFPAVTDNGKGALGLVGKLGVRVRGSVPTLEGGVPFRRRRRAPRATASGLDSGRVVKVDAVFAHVMGGVRDRASATDTITLRRHIEHGNVRHAAHSPARASVRAGRDSSAAWAIHARTNAR